MGEMAAYIDARTQWVSAGETNARTHIETMLIMKDFSSKNGVRGQSYSFFGGACFTNARGDII
jgi:hypothetical protein